MARAFDSFLFQKPYLQSYTYIHIRIIYIYIYYYTYIYETKNYFSTTEGEFNAQYNDHKNQCTYCIDEKVTELSNNFGT